MSVVPITGPVYSDNTTSAAGAAGGFSVGGTPNVTNVPASGLSLGGTQVGNTFYGDTGMGTDSAFGTSIPSMETPSGPVLTQSSGGAKSALDDALTEHNENLQQASSGNSMQYGSLNPVMQGLQQLNALSSPNYSDTMTTELARVFARSDAASQALINGINAQRQNAVNLENTQATQYQHGLEALGVGNNSAMTTPTLLSGNIQAAQAQQQAKLSTINNEYDKALASAQVAADNEDLKGLTAQNDYINQLKTQQLGVLKEMSSMYQWANLSPYQQESLGIQGENANTNLSRLNLAQFQANYPATTQTSASLLTPFNGQTTTKQVQQSVNIGGQYYPAATLNGQQWYFDGTNYQQVP